MSYTIGSLFTGYGGLDIGVAEALNEESKVLWCSDVAPGPRKVLPVREPDAPNLGDITQINWCEIEPVDVLVGGSPCQDLSLAGRRAGMHPGTRSGLWESMYLTDDNGRLSTSFVEWMMGLPEEWVTAPELGLSRREQLQILGNGVVPQQATYAIRILAEMAEAVKEGE